MRGPQSALFGRNTLGGLVNITSTRPSLSARGPGRCRVPFGNHGAWDVRGSVSGPVVDDKLSLGLSFAQVNRDGFTVNDITGNTIDDRSAFSAKGQLLWTPDRPWETRVIVTGERARDGDYALNDVGALRANPFHAARDFEGEANRDIFGTTIQRHGIRAAVHVVEHDRLRELEDAGRHRPRLHAAAAPPPRQRERGLPVHAGVALRVGRRRAGARRRQRASSTGRPACFSSRRTTTRMRSTATRRSARRADRVRSASTRRGRALDDSGVGLFGQATVTLHERLDLTAGARFDHETQERAARDLLRSGDRAADARRRRRERSRTCRRRCRSPIAFSPIPSVYATVGRGYKAGGFNPASPAGSEAYGEEHTWNVEGGVKTLCGQRTASRPTSAVFHIDWEDLQLNVPEPVVPAQFYIANVGGAHEHRRRARAQREGRTGRRCLHVGRRDQRASSRMAASSSGVDVAGNKIPNMPDYTASGGLQYSAAPSVRATLVGRADFVFYGAFQYNDQNSLGQDAFSLVNLRFGVSAAVT